MGDIKLLNWNVRGLTCAARREAVKILIQQAGPSIICIQETKLDSVDRFLALEFLEQKCMCCEYPGGMESGPGSCVGTKQTEIQYISETDNEAFKCLIPTYLRIQTDRGQSEDHVPG